MDPKLLRLHYFLSLTETGSLNKTALALSVGKPAIRRSVRELESRLGVELFNRTRKGFVLTDAGRRFRDHCATIASDVSNLSSNFASNERTRGTVSLGLPPIAAKLIAAPLLRCVTGTFADIQLSVLEGYGFDVREWLDEGRVDIGLFYDGPGTNRTFAAPVLTEQLLLVGASNDAVLASSQCALEDALQLPLIVPGRRHGNRLQIEWFAETQGLSLNVAMEVDSLTLMIRLLAAGFGYALLPAVAIASELRAGTLRAMKLDPPFLRTLLMGTSPRRKTSAHAELLLPILRKLISEHGEGIDQYGQRIIPTNS